MTIDLLNSHDFWLPGSFTKNFRWGESVGLKRLYDNVRLGFDRRLEPVSRDEYRRRVGGTEPNQLIPINFFLLNAIQDGVSVVCVDELVFQAITAPHSERFDRLALFAFNLSHVGRWRGQQEGQRYPALWAMDYIVNRVVRDFGWDTARINANDIEDHLRSLPQFRAQTSHHKVGTNLHYQYSRGGLAAFATPRVERWWVDALFLTLDRLISDRASDGIETPREMYPELLMRGAFLPLSGKISPEKTFAIAHLVSLYSICGGLDRLNPDRVRELVAVALPNYAAHLANDYRPQGALHPTNPRILKSIPRECAELATLAGFNIVTADDLDGFDPDDFIRRRAAKAVETLRLEGIEPTMTAEELYSLTRGE